MNLLEKEVAKISIKDLVWDLHNLMSQQKLEQRIFEMIRDEWRKESLPNHIDNLLEEILTQETYPDFISNLNLEKKFREMIVEFLADQGE